MDLWIPFISIAFIILLLIYLSRNLQRAFRAKVKEGLARPHTASLLDEEDIAHLPAPVQKYLRYVGAIGKEKVYNVKMTVAGEMKMDPNKNWIKIHAKQYNFYGASPIRLFFMRAVLSGIPVFGLHSYTRESANMRIKAAGLFTVLDAQSLETRISDTTTLFNDMCCFAPATLIDPKIQWKVIDALTVKATFEAYGCKISANLYFNEKGELVNFASEDRYYIPLNGSCRKCKWSTPVGNYQERNGLRLATYGEAVWNFPEGDYCYAKFSNFKEIKYNCDRWE